MTPSGPSARFVLRVLVLTVATLAGLGPGAVVATPPQFRPTPNTDNGFERTLLQLAYLRYLERAHASARPTPACSPGNDAAAPYLTGVGSDNEDRTYRACRATCVVPPSAPHRGHVPHAGSNR